MSIRLVAVDVDGTLLTAGQKVLPRVQEAAARAAAHGVELVLCTGRSAGECREIFAALPQIRYAVLYTGAMAQNLQTGEVLYSCPLTADDARLIYNHLRRYDGLVNFFMGGEVYNDRQAMDHFERYYPAELKKLFEYGHKIVYDLDGMIASCTQPVEKFYVAFSGDEECKRAKADLGQLPYFVTGAGFTDLEVMNPNTNKGVALAALAEKLGLRREEVLAIGDSSNDEAMLRYAGTAVVMENGEEALKKTADLIAPSNEKGGVADILDKIVRGEL